MQEDGKDKDEGGGSEILGRDGISMEAERDATDSAQPNSLLKERWTMTIMMNWPGGTLLYKVSKKAAAKLLLAISAVKSSDECWLCI